MNAITVGTDLVEIARLSESLQRRGEALGERLFTPDEWVYCHQQHKPEQSLAARFAAKEALRKIFGEWGYTDVVWRELEVSMSPSGAPCVVLHGLAAQRASGYRFSISLSHTDNYAVAFCLAWRLDS